LRADRHCPCDKVLYTRYGLVACNRQRTLVAETLWAVD
jgi:hypothetical protein